MKNYLPIPFGNAYLVHVAASDANNNTNTNTNNENTEPNQRSHRRQP